MVGCIFTAKITVYTSANLMTKIYGHTAIAFMLSYPESQNRYIIDNTLEIFGKVVQSGAKIQPMANLKK